jgi:hypothetical protein
LPPSIVGSGELEPELSPPELGIEIAIGGSTQRVAVRGKPIVIPGWEGYEFFLHRSVLDVKNGEPEYGSSWRVSENITGQAFSNLADTQRAAIEGAKANLVKASREQLDRAIQHVRAPSLKSVKVSSRPMKSTMEKAKELEKHPNSYAAVLEYNKRVKDIEKKYVAERKKLTEDWNRSFDDKNYPPIAYHERSEIIERNEMGEQTALKQRVADEFSIGSLPISDYEYQKWAEYVDPRTKEIDKRRIEFSNTFDLFRRSLDADMEAARAKGEVLKYNVAGELDGFSQETKNLYEKRERLSRELEEAKEGWPDPDYKSRDLKKQAETEAKKQFESKWTKDYGGRPETVKAKAVKTEREARSEASLQATHDARSPRSRESDERQSNADTIEPDDPRVDIWGRDPGRVDVVGIDTPKKGRASKSKKPVRKSKRTGKVETQVRGVRR